MSNYPYSLNAIASHLRDLSKELSKLLDISHEDAWEMCIQKLDDKFLITKSSKEKKINDRIKNTLFNFDAIDRETDDSMS
tara:strand:+ start:1789 stop:2028 length:240 start_codon:yes stop_codon:yes gene_type:complete